MRYDGFRAWVGARLLGTRFATIRVPDSKIDALAKRIGVDPDLLLEVRAKAIIDLHARGLSPPLSNTVHDDKAFDERLKRIYQFGIEFPSPLYAAWRAECELRAVHPPTFLRSLIHAYLLGAREPQVVKHWAWQGKMYKNFDRIQEQAVIPQGAKRALWRRSALLGTQPAYVVRGLVIEAMDGKHQRLPLVTAGMMYDDESRYNTGETLPP